MGEFYAEIGTDVATLVLFHPDDLKHRHDNPIAWYSYDFAYARESRAGALVGWITGSDGGYGVRMTQGALTDKEKAAECKGWTYPYRVRHGRVLLDNTDALPGVEQMTDPQSVTQYWYAIENGDYRVSVHPIARGSDADLPDYVVVFTPVPSLEADLAAPGLPDVRPDKDWEPSPTLTGETPPDAYWPTRRIPLENVVAMVVAQEINVLPTSQARFPVSDAVAELASPKDGNWDDVVDDFVLASAVVPGQLAIVCRNVGQSRMTGQSAKLSLQGRALVRITSVKNGPVLPAVGLEQVARPETVEDGEALASLRAKLVAAGEAIAPSSFEIERLEALTRLEGVTTWALTHMAMPLDRRLGLFASAGPERVAGIERLLKEKA